MFNNTRIALVLSLLAGLIWNCGGERLTRSQTPEAADSAARPLGKLALDGMTRAVVVASVRDGGMPLDGVSVEFSRSVSGRSVDFEWSGTTNARGQAYVEIGGAGVTGYYAARATSGGSEIGSWLSIPVNSGYQSAVELPIGESARATGSISLTPGGLPAKVAVGVAMPLSGPQIVYGGPAMEGLEFALEEINNSSKLGGAKIEFIVEDTEGAIDAATAAFNKLINEDGVDVILGPGISTVAKAVFPIAQRNQVVAFSPISAAAGLSAIGNYVFRASLSVGTLVPGAVRETQEKLRYQRVAMIVDDADVYSRSLDEALSNALAEIDVEILTRETFATGDTTFSDQLANVEALNPHAVFVSCLAAEMVPLLIQAREAGIPANVPIIVPDLTPDEVAAVGEAAERAITVATWASIASTPGNRAFVDGFNAKHGAAPSPWAALSYASLHLLADAIAAAGSTDARAIREAMAKTRDVDTILGRFSFDGDGDAVYEPIVMIVRDGAFEVFE